MAYGGETYYTGYGNQPYGYAPNDRSPYSNRGRGGRPGGPRPKRRANRALIAVAVVLALVAAALCGLLIADRLTALAVTVNGQPVELRKGATVQTLLDEGYAAPRPGDLLAIDGSVCTPGAGTPHTIAVNGVLADEKCVLEGGEQVVIGDGANVVEDVVVTEEPVPHGWYDDSKEFSSYWTGSIHTMSDGRDGTRMVRRGAVSGIEQVSEGRGPVDGGYHVYTAQVDRPVIALTFDDGPWPDTTSQILDVLEAYGARATFFTIGNQIPGREDLVRRARDLGCEVCTHTWDHASGSGQGVNITYMSAEEQIYEVLQGYAAIADALGEEPSHVIRAPGGNFYGSAIDNLWPYVDAEVGWNVDTEDWRRPGADVIAARIMAAQPGQIVLMHDGGGDRWQTVEALRQALPVLAEQGYEFVTVSELIAMTQA